MATEIYSGPLGEVRTISTAGGGTALTTTAAYIHIIPGTNWLALTARNFSTAVVAKFALNPFLIVIKTTDALVAVGNLTDYSNEAQDGLASTDVTLSSLTAGAFVYIGSHVPFRGVTIDVDAANSTASTDLTVKYWNGSAWASISATDNTVSGGISLAQDGTVTWTVPSTWVPVSLRAAGDTLLFAPADLVNPKIYWTRWEWDATMDSATTLNSIIALNRDTAQYGELISGQSFETAVHRGRGGVAAVEALTDAGTANLVVNAAVRGSGGSFG